MVITEILKNLKLYTALLESGQFPDDWQSRWRAAET
jgi:hypothetical protein